MDLAQLEPMIIAYIDNEVLPAMQGNDWKRLTITAGYYQAKSTGKISSYIEQAKDHPMLAQLNIVDGDGQVGCIDTICDSLKEALERMGHIDVPYIETKFTSSDVDVLRRYLKGEAGAVG